MVDELGRDKFQTLSKNEKAYIATTMFGTYQRNRGLTLLNNYNDSLKNYENALNSAGTAEQKFGIYQESTAAKMDRAKTSIEGFWQNALSSDTLKSAIDAFNTLMEILDKLVNSSMGSFLIQAGLISTTLGILRIGFKSLAGTAGVGSLISVIGGLLNSFKLLALGESTLAFETTALRASFTALKVSLATFLPTAVIIGLGLLVELFIKAKDKAKEAQETFEKSITTFNTNKNEVKNLEDLAKQYDILNSKYSKTIEEKQKLINIQNQIGNSCKELGVAYDNEGNAIINNSQQIQEYINLKKQQLELDNQKIKETYSGKSDQYSDDIKKKKQEIIDLEKKLNQSIGYKKSQGGDTNFDAEIEEYIDNIKTAREELLKLTQKNDALNLSLLNTQEKFNSLSNGLKSNLIVVFNELKKINPNANLLTFLDKIDVEKINKYSEALKDFKENGNIEDLSKAYDELRINLLKAVDGNEQVADSLLQMIAPTESAKLAIFKFQRALKDLKGQSWDSASSMIQAFANLGISINMQVASILVGFGKVILGIKDMATALQAFDTVAREKSKADWIAGGGNPADERLFTEGWKKSHPNTKGALEQIGSAYESLLSHSNSNNNIGDTNPLGGSSPSSSSTKENTYETDKYANSIEILNQQLKQSEYLQSKLTESSEQYRSELEKQIQIHKNQQDLAHSEADRLRSLRSAFAEGTEDFDKYTDKINDLGSSWMGWQENIDELLTEIKTSKTSSYDQQYESINSLITQSENTLSKYNDTSKEYGTTLSSIISLQQQEQSAITDEINLRKQELSTQQVGTTEYNNTIERMQTLISKYWDLTKAIQQNQQAQKEYENKLFQNNLDMLDKSIEPYSNMVSNIKSNMDLLSDTDYEGKINLTTQAMNANKDLVSQLQSELSKLQSTVPENSTQEQALAQSIKSTTSALFSAKKETISYAKELGQLQLAKIKSNFDKITDSLSNQIDVTEHLIEMMQDGIPTGVDLTFNYATEVVDNTENEDIENLSQAGIDVQNQFYQDSIEAQKNYQQEMIDETRAMFDEQTKSMTDFFNNFLNMVAQINGVHIFDTTLSDFAKTKNASEETIAKLKELEKQLQQLEERRIKETDKNTQKTVDINNDGYDDITGKAIDSFTDNLTNTQSYFTDLIDTYGTNWDKIINVVQGKISTLNGLTPSIPNVNNNTSNTSNNQNNNTSSSLGTWESPWDKSGGWQGTGYYRVRLTPTSSQGTIYIDSVDKFNKYYAKGTKGHPGGLAIIDDGKDNELIIEPGKEPYIHKEKGAKLVDLPKDTQVIPADETEDILKNRSYRKGSPLWEEYYQQAQAEDWAWFWIQEEYGYYDEPTPIEYYWADTGKYIGSSEPNQQEIDKHYTSSNSSNSNNSNNEANISAPANIPEVSQDVNGLYDKLLGQVNSNITTQRNAVNKYSAIANMSEGSYYIDEENNTVKVTANMIAEASKKAIEATNSLMSAEKKLKSVLKDKFDYEFDALEKQNNGLNDSVALEDDIQHQLNMLSDTDLQEKFNLTEQLLGTTKDQKDALTNLKNIAIAERDIYQVGSTEWTILNDKINDYNEQIEDVDENLNQLNQTIINTKFDVILQSLEVFDDKLDDIDFVGSLIDEKDVAGKINNIQQQISTTMVKIYSLKSQIANADSLGLTTEQVVELKETLEDAVSSVYDLNNSMKELGYNEIIDNIEKLRDVSEKYYDEQSEYLDKELEKNNELIEQKLDLLDKEEQLEDYNKDLLFKQKERNEIQDELNKLIGDNSASANTKRTELTEQLKGKDEEIADFQLQRNRELRKQNLEEQKDSFSNDINLAKEALTIAQDAENEKWNTIITALQDGTLTYDQLTDAWYQDTITNLTNFDSDTTTYVNKIKSTFESLGNMEINPVSFSEFLSQYGYTPTPNTSNSTSTTVGFDTGGGTGNNEGLAYLHKKELVLNDKQTSAMLKLKDYLPDVVEMLKNKKDILLENLRLSIPSFSFNNLIPAFEGAGDNSISNSYVVNLNIASLTGDKKGADYVCSAINKSIKKLGK
ncbi:MAG: hypothetical protein LLF98_02035 [Clostridium sp.]|nr:hypothetical protein [Clostridium sp.]